MDLKEAAVHVASQISLGLDGSLSLNYDEPTTGYYVGGKSWSLVGVPYHVDLYAVMDYLEAHKKVLSWPSVFVGWWTHNSKIYLDITDHVQGRYEAANLARVRHEIAIWDIQTSTEVKVF